ncbi:hypothetical protein BaRGS_00023172 [Batillaria attramentaria]|uniref:Uncharacterized protein n=1 Tax=Batillaria attramentaria TaxID=370345 RepID=A0ABD0KF28_9CAEN
MKVVVEIAVNGNISLDYDPVVSIPSGLSRTLSLTAVTVSQIPMTEKTAVDCFHCAYFTMILVPDASLADDSALRNVTAWRRLRILHPLGGNWTPRQAPPKIPFSCHALTHWLNHSYCVVITFDNRSRN